MYRLRIRARDLAHADALSDALAACLDPETPTVGLIETQTGWHAEGFYIGEPDTGLLSAHLARMLGGDGRALKLDVEALAERDWVVESLEALPPVRAGRFVVHGAHDRPRVAANDIGIEIEAGLAFGTGHHGTTRGCLMALDRLLKARRFRRPLDVGTGTGVLAIAAAKALRVPVAASDLDPVAVRVTAGNAAKNGVAPHVRAFVADGVRGARIARDAPYDLVLANILANPLVELAPGIARLTAPGGFAVLSGLLTWQRRQVEAAWRGQGFVVASRIALDGWATLVLARR